jgi:hypothetical protein
MNYNCIIGIDPGASGGIAMYDGTLHTARMPKDLNDLRYMLLHSRETYNNVCVFVEKLSIQHRDFAEAGKIFRLQKMLKNYEQLKAVIGVCMVDMAEVHPLTWQSRLGLRIKGEEKHQRKLRYRTEASRFYPVLKPTLWNCDAVLIMHFGRTILQDTTRKAMKWKDENLHIADDNNLFNFKK